MYPYLRNDTIKYLTAKDICRIMADISGYTFMDCCKLYDVLIGVWTRELIKGNGIYITGLGWFRPKKFKSGDIKLQWVGTKYFEKVIKGKPIKFEGLEKGEK